MFQTLSLFYSQEINIAKKVRVEVTGILPVCDSSS